MQVLEFLKRNWKVVAIVVAAIVLFVVVAFSFEACGDFLFNRNVEKQKENVNALHQNANAIRNELDNLEIQEAIEQERVNQRTEEYRNSQIKTNEARNVTNSALNNVNRIESANYSNSGLSNALKARCRAFPDSPECR